MTSNNIRYCSTEEKKLRNLPLYCIDTVIEEVEGDIEDEIALETEGPRFRTTCPDTETYNLEDLRMRRKVEVLKYKGAQSGNPNGGTGVVLTKKQKYVRLTRQRLSRNQSYATQSINYTNPNTKNLNLTNNTLSASTAEDGNCPKITSGFGYAAGMRGSTHVLTSNNGIPLVYQLNYNRKYNTPA